MLTRIYEIRNLEVIPDYKWTFDLHIINTEKQYLLKKNCPPPPLGEGKNLHCIGEILRSPVLSIKKHFCF